MTGYPWSAHDILTASDLNAAFSTAIGTAGAWTGYTPSWTQSGAITKTVSYANYSKDSRRVNGEFYLVATGAGTANNPIIVGLPVTASRASGPCGSGYFFDASSGTFYQGTFDLASTTTAKLVIAFGTGYAGQTGGQFTAAIATSDVLAGELNYQSAT